MKHHNREELKESVRQLQRAGRADFLQVSTSLRITRDEALELLEEVSNERTGKIGSKTAGPGKSQAATTAAPANGRTDTGRRSRRNQKADAQEKIH